MLTFGMPGSLDNKQNAFKFINLSPETALFVLRPLLKETEDIHSKRRSLVSFIKYCVIRLFGRSFDKSHQFR